MHRREPPLCANTAQQVSFCSTTSSTREKGERRGRHVGRAPLQFWVDYKPYRIHLDGRLIAAFFISPDARLATAASNDECEQFDHGDSDRQGGECYWIVIEPMTLLYIHDAPPQIVNRCRFVLPLHFELLDERSDMPGDWSRESVVLGLEAIADGQQPNASIASRNRSAPRGLVQPRTPDRERRLLPCR